MYWIQTIDNGPRRVNHAAAALKHFIYSFGGYSNTEDYSRQTPIDIHILNTKTLKWNLLSKPDRTDSNYSSTPYSRYGHTVVVYKEKFYLWGGRNDHSGACNRLFTFDPKTHRWSIVSVHGYLIPSARDGHSACLIHDRMYIFGGFEDDNQQFSNELYYFDFLTSSWHYHSVPSGSEVPQWRDFHSATNLNNSMYVFGGRYDHIGPLRTPQNIYDNRLYVFHPKHQSWSLVPAKGQIPCGRRSHSAFVYQNKLYIFGGYNNVMGDHFNDLHEFDPERLIWRQIHPCGLSNPIPRRRQCCLVIDHQMFMFGGTSPVQTSNHYSNEIQEIDGLRTRLYDQSDLYVLDFAPTLKTLCFVKMVEKRFKLDFLPKIYHNDYRLFLHSNSSRHRPSGETSG